MGLCRASGSKSKRCPQQFRLFPAYLLLRFEYGIDKFLVRDLAAEMLLSHIIVYLEFGVFKEFLAGPCPDVERRIPVVGYIDAHKFGTG